jgi:hypothetical protein
MISRAGRPDAVVAAIMAALALQGATTVIRQALAEIRTRGRLTSHNAIDVPVDHAKQR